MHRSRICEENAASGGERPFSPRGAGSAKRQRRFADPRVGMRGKLLAEGQGNPVCTPSPQPLSREGRGAFLNTKLHALLQARDLCIP